MREAKVEEKQLILENDTLRVIVLPERGGKLASLTFHGTELLAQPSAARKPEPCTKG